MPPKKRERDVVESVNSPKVIGQDQSVQGVCSFILNGTPTVIDNADPLAPLANTIREKCDLTGTKVACGQGNCGACTVMIQWPQGSPWYTETPTCVNSCLFPTGRLFIDPATPQSQWVSVLTVEGAMQDERIRQVGLDIAECNGTQCGFCTAGMVMKAAYYQKKVDSAGGAPVGVRDIEDLLEGNLCRCTGFRPILYALKKHFNPNDAKIKLEIQDTPDLVKKDASGSYAKCYATGDYSSKNVFVPVMDSSSVSSRQSRRPAEETKGNAFLATHKGTIVNRSEVAKPKMVVDRDEPFLAKPQVRAAVVAESTTRAEPKLQSLATQGRTVANPTGRGDGVWYTPYDAASLLELLKSRAGAGRSYRLVAGNASSAWTRLYELPVNTDFISLSNVAELTGQIKQDGGSIKVPANATLDDWLSFLDTELKPRNPNDPTLELITQHTFATANIQVRHLGTIAGNIIYSNSRKGILHSDISLLFSALSGVMVYTLDGKTEQSIKIDDYQKQVNAISDPWIALRFEMLTPLESNVVVRVARTGDRPENFPTSCSAAFSFQPGKSGHIRFTGPHKMPDGSTKQPAPVLIPLDSDLSPSDLPTALKLIEREIDLNPLTRDLANSEKQLMIQMSVRVLTLDSPSEGVQIPSLLEERKQQGQTQNSQHFYVDPLESPLTEPLVKNDAYLAATGTSAFPIDSSEPNQENGAPVLSPATIMLFDPFVLLEKGSAFVSSIDVAARFFTAASSPYDPATDAVNAHADLPWIDAKYQSQIDGMFTNRNVMFGDFGCGGNYQYGVPNKGKAPSNDPTNKANLNKYGAGGFGEFICGPGFTTYAGQIIAFVTHPDQTKARGIAAMITNEIKASLASGQPSPTLGSKFSDETSNLGILTIAQSREMMKAVVGSEVQFPGVYARGLGTFTDDQSKKQYEEWWTQTASDPRNVYVELMPGDMLNNPELYNSQLKIAEKQAIAQSMQNKTPLIQAGPILASSQIHSYMETQTCLISKCKEGRYYIESATQGVTDISGAVAGLLNVPVRDVVVRNNRVGGSYGGKTVFAMYVSCACAWLAALTNKATRLSLDFRDDYMIVGKRHSVEGRYRMVVRADGSDPMVPSGKILGWDLWFDGDAGSSTFVSPAVLSFSGMHGDSVYNIDNYRCECNAYLTHKQSSTAYRSFGGIQAITVVESAMDHAYFALSSRVSNLTIEQFRQTNFYKPSSPNPHTPYRNWVKWSDPTGKSIAFTDYHQELLQTDIMSDPDRGVWSATVGKDSEYQKALQEVNDFNAKNKYRKRGIAAIPLKYVGGWDPKDNFFGMAAKVFDQNGALVNIYTGGAIPGCVLVEQCGVEMGQGVHMHVLQTAAATLDIPVGLIRIGPMSTDCVPNQVCTGASSGTDLNVPAVRQACTALRYRLKQMNDNILRVEALRRLADTTGAYKLTSTDRTLLKQLVDEFDPKVGFLKAANIDNPSAGWVAFQKNAILVPIEYLNPLHFIQASEGKPLDPPVSNYASYAPRGMYQVNYYLAAFRSWCVPEPVANKYDNWGWDYKLLQAMYLDDANYRSGQYDAILRQWDPKTGWAATKPPTGQWTLLRSFIEVQLKTGAAKPKYWQDLLVYLTNNRPTVFLPGAAPDLPTLSDLAYYWSQVVSEGYNNRVQLSAVGKGRAEADGDAPVDNQNWFAYFIYASAWAVVEVDGVTGETDVLRTDIYYDAGNSINPATDIGQVEGAFVQGMGNVLTEECDWSATTGVLNQRCIMDYAIPCQRTIPRSLNTYLFWLKGGTLDTTVDNRPDILRRQQIAVWKTPRAKAASEASTCMSIVVLLAARVAISDLRKSLWNGLAQQEYVQLSTPLVPHRVLAVLYGENGNFSRVNFT